MGFFEALWMLYVEFHKMAFAGIFTLPVIGLLLFLYLIFVDAMIIISPFVIFGGFFEKPLSKLKSWIKRLSDNRRQRSEKKIAKRSLENIRPQVDTLILRVNSSLGDQDHLLDLSSGYLMKRDWDAELAKSRPLLDELSALPEKAWREHPEAPAFERFRERHSSERIRSERNEKFKERELAVCDAMLSSIDGKSLDPQQRDAVVTDEYSNLVIAGAGSGKTLTVVGKVKYLVERRGVRPEDILVTSFTRKSLNEVAERIERSGIENVSCFTFHKIGLDRLGKVGVANENELSRCVMGYLRDGILSHPDQMAAYIEFYGLYKHVPKDYSQFKSDGERMEALKAEDLTTLKGQLAAAGGELDTLGGERVKSLEELMIANFLFLHGVAYEYERNYDGDYETEGRAYQPDFYLTDYGIWLEHFGINEDGRCPWIESPIEERKYIEGIQWKRQVHEANGTRLIESYSYWNKDHDLLNKLRDLLETNGVALKEDNALLADIYARLRQNDKYLRSIARLVSTFLSLAKANNVTMADAGDKGRAAYRGDGFMWHRFELFMSFAEPIMELYQQTLRSKGQVDFDDMINMTARKIAEEGLDAAYEYIIVDEYQDISKSRFGLIKAIRDACGARLMCVGDDWQSIYRFAGSDVSLFTSFGDYVGFHETMKIERTYRNSQELVDIASEFVERNPSQIHKEMRSDKHEDMPVVITMKQDMAEGLESTLDSILSRVGYSGHILVLGRHNFDIETAYPEFKGCESYEGERMALKRDRKTGDVHMRYRGYGDIVFMSVHRAKGLEADDVVVLNLTNGTYGFPNRVEDDPILQILLGKSDEFEFAEERRLFYVAITRTKCTTFLVSGSLDSGGGPSPFVDELKSRVGGHIGIMQRKSEDLWHPALCPRCGTGRLVVRQNSQTGQSFLGCTNYPFCERSYSQTEIVEDKLKCPSCGGWMVRRRRGEDGQPFFGCSNFPDCSATVDADDSYNPTYTPRRESRPRGGCGSVPTRSSGYTHRTRANKASSEKCPKCGRPLKLMTNGKDGSTFYGCTGYPSCRYTRSARDASGASRSNAMRCPRCGAPLKELTNKKDGSVFYGCTKYPKCKYTRSK